MRQRHVVFLSTENICRATCRRESVFYHPSLKTHSGEKFENTQWRKVCLLPSKSFVSFRHLSWQTSELALFTVSWHDPTLKHYEFSSDFKRYTDEILIDTKSTCQMWTDNHRFGRKSRWLQSHPRRFWWLQVHKKFINNFTENLWLGPRRALCSKHLRRWDRCTLAEHDIGLERRSRRSFPAKAATVLATLQWPPTLRFVRLQIWTKDFRKSSSYVLSICYFLGSSDDDWTYWILKYLLYHLESAISKQDK